MQLETLIDSMLLDPSVVLAVLRFLYETLALQHGRDVCLSGKLRPSK